MSPGDLRFAFRCATIQIHVPAAPGLILSIFLTYFTQTVDKSYSVIEQETEG
jgi:hypothetical protein